MDTESTSFNTSSAEAFGFDPDEPEWLAILAAEASDPGLSDEITEQYRFNPEDAPIGDISRHYRHLT